MNIGVLAVDSIIFNLALMRLSAWHKAQGDTVEIASPLFGRYDRVYRSKQFIERPLPSGKAEYPDDRTPWGCEVISGGTGYDLTTILTADQDTSYPDYPLYGCEHAIGRLTRGCVRRCPWCVVWRQDGRVRQVAELSDFWRGQSHVRLLDDNLLAKPALFREACEAFTAAGTRVSFEALDARLLTDDAARLLMRVKRWKPLHFAWDAIADEEPVMRGLLTLKKHYPSMHDVLVYVLIGFDTTPAEDLYRVVKLRTHGIEPFIMPFDKADPYQKAFARWGNAKQLRKVPWSEYRRGMGHGKASA